ncbi:MAG TPA: hypothetical protein PLX60_04025 [Chitinophagales bacterium]|nr:hypothetical protein [Chitinophagales bacterium]
MQDSKLINLISMLSDEERRKLRKWIKSDFVNKNEDIIAFFEFIDTRSSLTMRTVSKEKAHDYLYPNTPYHDLRIRHLLWMTTEIVENFIIYNSVAQQPSLKMQLLAQYYTKNELYKFAHNSVEEGIAMMEKIKLRNASYHLQQYQIQALHFQINSKNNRSKEFNLQDVIDHVTLFSIIETLKYACIIQSLQKISELKIENHLLEATLTLVENPVFLEDIAVRIYYNIYLVIRDENEAAFNAFIKDVKENENYFTTHDLKDLYLLAINFCVKKSNQNLQEYTQQAFELYIYAIDKGYLLEHREISRFSFTNVVTLGIKLKEFSKTENFIKQYADFIAAEYRQNTVDFNSAKVFFSKEQPQKALKILLTNEFKDMLWNLNAKYMVIKILFEMKDLVLFANHLKAYKNYVKRKTNIGYHQTYFINVVNALTTLMDVYKKPENFKGFEFDASTPDIEWFRKALKNIDK